MPNSKIPKWAPPPHLSCLSCKSVHHTEWCSLGADQLDAIDQAKASHRYRSGDIIYRQGEAVHGIYCIEAGTVAVRITQADGDTKIVRIADAGQTLGYSDFFGGRGYRSSAVVLEDATLCHIPAEPLRSVLSHSPALGLAFLAHSADDLLHADTMNMQQALHTVRMRVVHMLLSLKDKHGSAGTNGDIEVTVPMSWQEVGELIGARPETVSRTIQSLTEDGVMEVTGRRVKINDLDRLLDEIESVQA